MFISRNCSKILAQKIHKAPQAHLISASLVEQQRRAEAKRFGPPLLFRLLQFFMTLSRAAAIKPLLPAESLVSAPPP